MSLPIEITIKHLEILHDAKEYKAKRIMEELKAFCNKGDDYAPTFFDYARFRKCAVEEVYYCIFTSLKSIVDHVENKGNSEFITFNSKYGGKAVLPIRNNPGKKR